MAYRQVYLVANNENNNREQIDIPIVIAPDLKELVEQEGNYFMEPWQDYFIWGRRHWHMGHWCGYVSVPPTSPLRDRSLVGTDGENIEVHGGLTCMGLVTDEKHPDYIVYGFDCAHADDIYPFRLAGMPPYPDMPGAKYRTRNFVLFECLKLAEQLKQIEKDNQQQP